MRRTRPWALALALFAAAGCGTAGRPGLPSPFPLTHGATPLPADGLGAGFEFGQGLRRPEQQRADLLTLFIAGGLANRVSASYATYEGRTVDDVRGAMWRLKVRLGGPFGPSTGLQLGYARMDRSLFAGQHDRLRSVDLVAPTEFTLTSRRSRVQLRAICGPRATVERYTDLTDPERSAHVLYIGALGGAHLSLGALHLFAEATLTRLPQAPGENWSYRAVLLPTIGVLFQADVSESRHGLPSARR